MNTKESSAFVLIGLRLNLVMLVVVHSGPALIAGRRTVDIYQHEAQQNGENPDNDFKHSYSLFGYI